MQFNNSFQCPWPLAFLISAPVASMGAQASGLLGPLPHLSSFALQPEKQTREYTSCPLARGSVFPSHLKYAYNTQGNKNNHVLHSTVLCPIPGSHNSMLKTFSTLSSPNVPPNFCPKARSLHFPPPVPAKFQHTCAFASSSTGNRS